MYNNIRPCVRHIQNMADRRELEKSKDLYNRPIRGIGRLYSGTCHKCLEPLVLWKSIWKWIRSRSCESQDITCSHYSSASNMRLVQLVTSWLLSLDLDWCYHLNTEPLSSHIVTTSSQVASEGSSLLNLWWPPDSGEHCAHCLTVLHSLLPCSCEKCVVSSTLIMCLTVQQMPLFVSRFCVI